MNSLLSLRSASRSSSPAPSQPQPGSFAQEIPSEHSRSRPFSRIHGLSAFRRASPSPVQTPPTPLVQDGNYLDALTLKLAEGASRALAPPTAPPTSAEPCLLKGKWPIPPGRGRAFGALITSELKAAQDNLHLYRAIQRIVHRPLSALLSTLSINLPPLINSPAFLPLSSAAAPSPTLLHALALSSFASELLETFESIGLGSANVTSASGSAFEGLKDIREGLENIVAMVLHPLMSAIKAEVAPLIDGLELPSSKVVATPTSTKSPPKGYPPHLVALWHAMPCVSRALARYTSPQCAPSRAALASLFISLIWRSLVALAYRPIILTAACLARAGGTPTPPATPPLIMSKKTLTPPATPPGSRFSIRLPINKDPSLTFSTTTALTSTVTSLTNSTRRSSISPALSRPPSPPVEAKAPIVALAQDSKTLIDLFASSPKPHVGTLAREAVDEALGTLEHFTSFLAAFAEWQNATPHRPNHTQSSLRDIISEDVPTLITLPLLLRALPAESSPSIPTMLGLSEAQYRTGCLTGFGTAEECEPFVLRAVCASLEKAGTLNICKEKEEIIEWLHDKINHS